MRKSILFLPIFIFTTVLFLGTACTNTIENEILNQMTYTMPSEEHKHEGTWLQWPHDYTYRQHIERHEKTFVEIAKALHTGEQVHIVVYNEVEKNRVEAVLTDKGLNMSQIDFFIFKTNDYWIRDNGPIFVNDENGNQVIQNWGFNGWGNKAPYRKCNEIPNKISTAIGIEHINVNMINEGGSIEIDGKGTLMAKKSSIINNNRNPGLSQSEIEAKFTQYLGVTNFIWLQGYAGADITDDHIDGTARFANEHTIVTLAEDVAYEGEFEVIKNARNIDGNPYTIVELPFTKNKLPGSTEKGIYVNFYVGNEVVLVPNFNDVNDAIANSLIQNIYPNRRVVGILAIELGIDGGGLHCVTQQQPLN